MLNTIEQQLSEAKNIVVELQQHLAELEAEKAALREAHSKNLHQGRKVGYSELGHRCSWRVAYEAVQARSKSALLAAPGEGG